MNEEQLSALVVDDEPVVCKSVMMCLHRQGFKCRSAFDGEQATRLLDDNHFDAVITDPPYAIYG